MWGLMLQRWCRSPTACCDSRWRPSRRSQLDRHRSRWRKQQSGDRRAVLAERRRLQLVARGVPVELEALRLGRSFQPVEMLVEIGDAVVRIELHHFFKVPHHASFIPCRPDKAQAPRLRGSAAVPKHGL